MKRRMKTLSWRKDHKLKRGTVSLRDTCKREILQRSIRDKRIPREAFFDLGDVKVENVIVTFSEQEDEDTVVDVGPQIERVTVFLRDACHRVVYQRNSRDKRFAGEACFDLGDAEVEKDFVTFNEEEDEDTLVGEEPH